MKSDIMKVVIFSIFLVVISFVVTLSMGKIYTVVYDSYNKNDYDLSVENDTGEIEIIDKKVKKDKYLVKVKAKKSGKVYLSLNWNDFRTTKVLYVHKSMVITEDDFFGKSTGSEIVPISFSVILLYILYILIKKYRFSLKESIYQYKNIAYLGVIIFLLFFLINNTLSIINYQGLFETVNRVISSFSFVSIILFPISFVTFILVTISNINLIRREGKSLRNLLGLFLGIFICLLTLLPDYIYEIMRSSQKIDIYNLNNAGPYIYDFCRSLVYLTVAYLECVLISTIIIAVKSVRKKIVMNKDYMIILGCQTKKDGSLTPLLKGRVDRAIEFRNEQLKNKGKDLIFVPSGGKGDDEVISEAEAMRKYLLKQGIKDKNILVENKSKNTYENIKFSNKLINDKAANIGFSTTNYHVLRAGLIANEQGLKFEGIGAKTKSYFWINAFIREYVGTLYSEKKKHILLFLLITIIIVIMILIMFLGNNI